MTAKRKDADSSEDGKPLENGKIGPWPLSFEDALKGLVATPPMPKGWRPPRVKKTGRSASKAPR